MIYTSLPAIVKYQFTSTIQYYNSRNSIKSVYSTGICWSISKPAKGSKWWLDINNKHILMLSPVHIMHIFCINYLDRIFHVGPLQDQQIWLILRSSRRAILKRRGLSTVINSCYNTVPQAGYSVAVLSTLLITKKSEYRTNFLQRCFIIYKQQ